MDRQASDADLLAQFIAAFAILDDLRAPTVPQALRIRTSEEGWQQWQPQPVITVSSALDALYRGLGFSGQGAARFPPLYEALLLAYRWAEVDLGTYRLLANEPAEDFSPLLTVLQADKSLYATLLPNAYVPFGRGPDSDYDPVCFDFRQRQKNGDCRIVKLDHEAVLCDNRIREVAELAPNFRSLVLNTIQKAASLPTRRLDMESL